MPQIETWSRLPAAVRAPMVDVRQLTPCLLWPHLQEQMFFKLNRQLSIGAG